MNSHSSTSYNPLDLSSFNFHPVEPMLLFLYFVIETKLKLVAIKCILTAHLALSIQYTYVDQHSSTDNKHFHILVTKKACVQFVHFRNLYIYS